MTLFLVYVYLRWVSMKNCGHIYIYIYKSRSENSEWKVKEFFVCEREEKSWNIEQNETNSSLKTLNIKCNKKLSWNVELKEIKSLYF